MRRKPVHLIAAIAESLRFFVVVFLAFSVGALNDSSVSSLLRYAAAPQLLFAVGFFFMWFDAELYGGYRPLLLVGKIASAICLLPLSTAVARDSSQAGAVFGLPGFGISLAFAVALVDIMSLSILILVKRGPDAPGGRGMDEIKQVEG